VNPTAALPAGDRLLRYITKTESGCWEWQRCKTAFGYGRIGYGGRVWTTHRLAAACWLDFDTSSGLQVLHHCDNPPCINPEHLFIGTAADNMQDCAAKNRLGGGRKWRTLYCHRGHFLAGDNRAGKYGACRTCRDAYPRQPKERRAELRWQQQPIVPLEVGQLWDDCDPRNAGRRVRVVEVGGSHAVVIAVRSADAALSRIPRRGRVALWRFRPGSGGFRLVAYRLAHGTDQ